MVPSADPSAFGPESRPGVSWSDETGKEQAAGAGRYETFDSSAVSSSSTAAGGRCFSAAGVSGISGT